MTVLTILCAISRQWLKLRLPNFHAFYANSLPSRPSTVEESSCEVSRHFRQFFTRYQVSSNMGGWKGPRWLFQIFEEKGLGVHQAKLWASRAFGMAKMKGKSQ